MEPTISVGRNILVSLFPRSESLRPTVGSIVVLHPPRGADPTLSGVRGHECAVTANIERGMPCPRSRGGRWADELYVKRIVAGPGDSVALRDGRVIRNGVPVDEPFVKPTCEGTGNGPHCTLPRAVRLPPNRYFLMGDNRGESNDSRFWGPVPRAWMVGVVTQIGVPDPGLFR
jgi:signal peptidase I